MAAPASPASMQASAISLGDLGRAGWMPAVSPEPVLRPGCRGQCGERHQRLARRALERRRGSAAYTAHVMMTSRLMVFWANARVAVAWTARVLTFRRRVATRPSMA